MKKNITKTLVAGKLALASTQVHSTGKCNLTLSEEGAPRDILTAPVPQTHPNPKNSGSKGDFYPGMASYAQINFTVEGVPNDDRSWRIYLFYSQRLAEQPSNWAGGFAFKRSESKVLTGVSVKGGRLYSQVNPFGSSTLKRNNADYSAPVVLPVDLSDMNDLQGLLYFQVLAFPVDNTGNTLWGSGCSSEVDRFYIHPNTVLYNPTYMYGKNDGHLFSGAPYRQEIHGY